MRAICICLPENPKEQADADDHFKKCGLENYEFFSGINAKKSGLCSNIPYTVDNPSSGYRIGYKSTGTWLSHYMLWNALSLTSDETFLILESDARFRDGWKERLAEVMKAVPTNFDFVNIGPCCVAGVEKKEIAPGIYKSKQSFCTHAYVIRRWTLNYLIRTFRICSAPIDIQLSLESYPVLNHYMAVPRLVDQENTDLPP